LFPIPNLFLGNITGTYCSAFKIECSDEDSVSKMNQTLWLSGLLLCA